MKKFILTLGVFGLMIGALVPVIAADTAQAARFGGPGDRNCTEGFLTFPAWYRGLERSGCNIVMPGSDNSSMSVSDFIFAIVVNLIEIGLHLVAYAAVGFIIYGGFKYLTAAGDSGRITAGRKTITNAVIGLIISFMAIAIVKLIANRII